MNVIENQCYVTKFDHIYTGDRFEDLEIESSQDVLRGIDDILDTYELQIVNPLRKDKKLLIVDVDCTLTHRDGRPREFMHEMLTRVYENYDIVLWSSTSKDAMEAKIESLDMHNQNYKVAFHLDQDAMVPVFSWTFDDYIYVKALDLIWKKISMYSAKNTIIFDDNWRNYAFNRRSGLSTSRYQDSASGNGGELSEVTEYLSLISKLINLNIFNHNHWVSNEAIMRKRSIELFERAIAVEEDIRMTALSAGSSITLQLLCSPEPPDLLPHNGRPRQPSQKVSKILTFIEKGRRKDTIEKLQLTTPEDFSSELSEKISACNIEILHSLRDSKKLLIVDLGYTLCDPDVTSFPSVEARRPHSVQLLTRSYQYYDIVIWSDMTSEDTMEALQKMGIVDNEMHKIAFVLTVQEMIIVKTSQYGSVLLKPLELIWRHFPKYSSKNTIIIDDNKWYFALNYQSGCEVKPYKRRNEELDVELEFLASYLEWISAFDNFEKLNHGSWRCPRKVLQHWSDRGKKIGDRRFRVDVEWYYNSLIFVNVPGDVTAGELKYFIHDAIGVAVATQMLLFTIPVSHKYENGRDYTCTKRRSDEEVR